MFNNIIIVLALSKEMVGFYGKFMVLRSPGFEYEGHRYLDFPPETWLTH
jgi:hypothetical protein